MNRRLAVPIILLLLFLFAGAVWALLGPLQLAPEAQKPAADTPQTARSAPADQSNTPDATAGPEARRAGESPASGKDASFDVVRIDPKGTSVFAGRAEPGAQVAIKADGKQIGTVEADENGEWTFTTEEKFASADPQLGLTVKPAEQVKKEVAAATPEKAQSKPKTSEPKPVAAAAGPEKPHTASAVTATLLNNLQGMVDAARSGQPEPSLDPQKAAPPANTPTNTPVSEPARNSVTAVNVPAAPAGEAVRKSIPVPITFVFNEATFTSDGRKAAALLLEYLKLKNYKKVTLTGHADERGSDDLNLELSRERLQTVADLLKAGGFGGELELVPKGKREPYLGVVRSEYGQEELWQLDRRVELVIGPDGQRTSAQ